MSQRTSPRPGGSVPSLRAQMDRPNQALGRVTCNFPVRRAPIPRIGWSWWGEHHRQPGQEAGIARRVDGCCLVRARGSWPSSGIKSGSKGAQLVPDATPTLPGDSAGEFPARVTSSSDIVAGKSVLTDEAMGWLAYLDRKITFDGTWFKDDNVHPSWDNYTGAPIGVYHRYDLSYATYSLGLMS